MGGLFSSEEHYEPKYHQHDYKKLRPGKNVYKIYKNFVYWRGEPVDGVNGNEFEDMGQGYGKDNRYTFYRGLKIAKVSTDFKTLPKGYAKDLLNVYYRGKRIQDADARTFKIVLDDKAKDNKHYYKQGKIIASKKKRRRQN